MFDETNYFARWQVHPVIRWLAGLTCPMAFVLGIVAVVFPAESMSHPIRDQVVAVGSLFTAGIYLGPIAVIGRLRLRINSRELLLLELEAAARSYVSGQISLWKYGSLTRELLVDKQKP